MKRVAAILPFLILLLSGITACHKDSIESTYFTFQYNNVNYSFDSIIVRVDSSVNGNETYIDAFNTSTTSSIQIALSSSFNITGKYSNDTWPNTDHLDPGFRVERFWLYVADRNGTNGGGGYDLFEMKSSPFTFTIEQSSDETMRIKGTFSGIITDHNSLSSGMLTDGKFNLPFLYH